MEVLGKLSFCAMVYFDSEVNKKEQYMTAPESKDPEEEKAHNVTKEGFVAFFSENRWDAFAYVVLLSGLLITVFEPFFGGLLVGIILGIYFSKGIHEKCVFFKDFLDKEGIFRGFILLAAIMALLMASPGLCIGAAIGAFMRPYLGKLVSSPFDSEDDTEDKK